MATATREILAKNEVLTTEEVASVLRVAPNFVRRRVWPFQLPLGKAGKTKETRRYSRKKFLEWLDSQSSTTTEANGASETA